MQSRPSKTEENEDVPPSASIVEESTTSVPPARTHVLIMERSWLKSL